MADDGVGRPFAGLRVVDASRVLAGPFCCQMLADMGADVIKIESPGGDENRSWPPLAENGISCNYASVNRGKRGLTLDLKKAAAGEVLERLIARADVVVHSFLPPAARRLGLDAEALRARHPRLIVCTISGYGTEGPLADKPGYDLMVQAFGGAMSVTGYDDGPPVRTGVSFVDMSTGLSAYGAIATVLYQRRETGEGSWVRASLLETLVAELGYHAVGWLQGGELPVKQGSGAKGLAPYQAFRCKDGHILVGAPNQGAWDRLCKALGDENLRTDPRFADNASRVENLVALSALLEAHFLTREAKGLAALLERHAIAVSPIQSVDQLMAHEQVRANAMVVEATDGAGRAWPLIGAPFKVGGSAASDRAPPALGEHTDEILSADLGLDAAEIARLRASGAV